MNLDRRNRAPFQSMVLHLGPRVRYVGYEMSIVFRTTALRAIEEAFDIADGVQWRRVRVHLALYLQQSLLVVRFRAVGRCRIEVAVQVAYYHCVCVQWYGKSD